MKRVAVREVRMAFLEDATEAAPQGRVLLRLLVGQLCESLQQLARQRVPDLGDERILLQRQTTEHGEKTVAGTIFSCVAPQASHILGT